MSDFSKILYSRRSIRKFKTDKVEQTKVDALIRAALMAPSGKRVYPCEFIVVNDAEILGKMATAKEHGAALIAKVPLAIAVVADTSKYDIWVEDASIAATFIMLEAENQGLGCCWVQMRLRGSAKGKTSTENLANVLNLKAEHEILAVLAIGYKDEEKPVYTEEHLKMEKVHYNGLK